VDLALILFVLGFFWLLCRITDGLETL